MNDETNTSQETGVIDAIGYKNDPAKPAKNEIDLKPKLKPFGLAQGFAEVNTDGDDDDPKSSVSPKKQVQKKTKKPKEIKEPKEETDVKPAFQVSQDDNNPFSKVNTDNEEDEDVKEAKPAKKQESVAKKKQVQDEEEEVQDEEDDKKVSDFNKDEYIKALNEAGANAKRFESAYERYTNPPQPSQEQQQIAQLQEQVNRLTSPEPKSEPDYEDHRSYRYKTEADEGESSYVKAEDMDKRVNELVEERMAQYEQGQRAKHESAQHYSDFNSYLHGRATKDPAFQNRLNTLISSAQEDQRLNTDNQKLNLRMLERYGLSGNDAGVAFEAYIDDPKSFMGEFHAIRERHWDSSTDSGLSRRGSNELMKYIGRLETKRKK